MQITRRYTLAGKGPFGAFNFVPRTSRIVNPDGTVVFEMKDLLAPEPWSQVAVDILAQKYFRKAGVPARTVRVAEPGVPEWLQRSEPASGESRAGQETDARQVFHRLAGCWAYWGWEGGYFSSEADAKAARSATGRPRPASGVPSPRATNARTLLSPVRASATRVAHSVATTATTESDWVMK